MHTATTIVLIRVADVAPESAKDAANRAVADVKAQGAAHGAAGAADVAGAAGAAVAFASEARHAAKQWEATVEHLHAQLSMLNASGTRVSSTTTFPESGSVSNTAWCSKNW